MKPEIESFKESIEKIYYLGLNRHRFYFLDIPKHQISIIKTYLWVSAFIITAQLAALKNFHLTTPYKIIALISVIIASSAFIIAIYTIKGKQPLNSHIENLLDMDDLAWEYAHQEHHETNFMRAMIDGMAKDINHLLSTSNSRGEKLRLIAWLLISSFIIGIIPIISLFI